MTTAEIVDALLLLGGGGLLAELVRSIVQRRKMSADVAGELTRSAVAMLQPLTDRVRSLEAEAEHLRVEAGHLRTELHDARGEADSLRHELHAARTELAGLRGKRPPHEPTRQE